MEKLLKQFKKETMTLRIPSDFVNVFLYAFLVLSLGDFHKHSLGQFTKETLEEILNNFRKKNALKPHYHGEFSRRITRKNWIAVYVSFFFQRISGQVSGGSLEMISE